MAEELKYPQLTEDQVDLWQSNQVTKAFIQCLTWKAADVAEAAGTGKLADSGNADLTHALIHHALGQQDAYGKAAQPEELLDFYNLIFRPPPEDEEEQNAGPE